MLDTIVIFIYKTYLTEVVEKVSEKKKDFFSKLKSSQAKHFKVFKDSEELTPIQENPPIKILYTNKGYIFHKNGIVFQEPVVEHELGPEPRPEPRPKQSIEEKAKPPTNDFESSEISKVGIIKCLTLFTIIVAMLYLLEWDGNFELIKHFCCKAPIPVVVPKTYFETFIFYMKKIINIF